MMKNRPKRTRKIQFFSIKVKLSNLQSKRILEEGAKLYGMLMDAMSFIDIEDITAKEAVDAVQLYLEDHTELDEAIKAW